MKNETINTKNKGFGLIELILYIAIISIFISAAVLFAWDIIYGRVKSQVQLEVNQNTRIIAQRITNEIRNATAINSVAGSSISLVSADPAKDPTNITLTNGQITIGQGSGGNCPTSNPCALTSSEVTATDLTFTNLSQGNSQNIKFSFTIESNADRPEWQKTQTYTSSVELKFLP